MWSRVRRYERLLAVPPTRCEMRSESGLHRITFVYDRYNTDVRSSDMQHEQSSQSLDILLCPDHSVPSASAQRPMARSNSDAPRQLCTNKPISKHIYKFYMHMNNFIHRKTVEVQYKQRAIQQQTAIHEKRQASQSSICIS